MARLFDLSWRMFMHRAPRALGSVVQQEDGRFEFHLHDELPAGLDHLAVKANVRGRITAMEREHGLSICFAPGESIWDPYGMGIEITRLS